MVTVDDNYYQVFFACMATYFFLPAKKICKNASSITVISSANLWLLDLRSTLLASRSSALVLIALSCLWFWSLTVWWTVFGQKVKRFLYLIAFCVLFIRDNKKGRITSVPTKIPSRKLSGLKSRLIHIHTTHTSHSTHTAHTSSARHGCIIFLGSIDDNGVGGEEHCCCRDSIL